MRIAFSEDFMKRQRFIFSITVAAAMSLSLLVSACSEPTVQPTEQKNTAPETTAPETTEPETTTVAETEDPKAAKKRLVQMAVRFNDITEGKDLQKYDAAAGEIMSRPIETGKIVFFGSSSFTRWSEKWNNPNLEDVMLSDSGEKICLNHGIGGSNISHLCFNYKTLVKPYEPKALCIYGMSNNSSEYNYSSEDIIFMLDFLLEQCRQDFPGIHFYVGEKQPSLDMSPLSIKNSKELNSLLNEYGDAHDDVTVVHTASAAFYYNSEASAGSYTDLKRNIFVEDGVHLIPEAYEDYAKVWREALKDELK